MFEVYPHIDTTFLYVLVGLPKLKDIIFVICG